MSAFNNDLLAQAAMQLQSPEAITQMAQSPVDPWALIAQISHKAALSTGPETALLPGEMTTPGMPKQPDQPKSIGQMLSFGALMSGKAAQQPSFLPARHAGGGARAPVPSYGASAPVRSPINLGALLARGGNTYGL